MIDKLNFSIQRLNKSTDIGQMAELIDLCFGQQMDPDGKKYLIYLRNLAREKHPLVASLSDSFSYSTSIDGFVCKVRERLIGNVNISPYQDGKNQILFISNVAVHPDFRNQGVASRLIQQVIDYASQSKYSSLWLQVRKENEIAYRIYLSIGFKKWGIRDTWVKQPTPLRIDEKLPNLLIIKRRLADWEKQAEWLKAIYPEEIQWQLEISPSNLKPQIWQWITNSIAGRYFLHWSFVSQQQLVGVITWQPSYHFADQLWLAARNGFEDQIIADAFPFIQNQLNLKKPLLINLPEGIGSHALPEVEFEKMHTLKWMKKQIN
jgi:ribosomal protein S18 acetylase RimI-like enzyme